MNCLFSLPAGLLLLQMQLSREGFSAAKTPQIIFFNVSRHQIACKGGKPQLLGRTLVIAPSSCFEALSLGFRLAPPGIKVPSYVSSLCLVPSRALIKVASYVSQISFWQRQLTPTARRIWPTCPLGASVLMNPSISRLANTIQPTKPQSAGAIPDLYC